MIELQTIDTAVGRHEVLDELQEGFWVADSQGRIVYANPALARILGLDSPEALVGRPWRELVPEADVGRLTRSRPSEGAVTVSTTLNSKSEQLIPASVTVMKRSAGRMQLQVGIVTPEAAPQPQSGIADATWRQIVENSVDGIAIVEQGKTIFANHRLEELAGYTVSQIQHLGLERLIAARDRRAVGEIINQPARLLTPVHYEVRIVHRSGNELECEMRVVPIQTKGQQPAILVFVRDVSQLKQAERSRNEVVAMLSHDLRTPLAAIKEAMSLLAETAATRLEDRQRRYLIIAREEIDRLNRMIDNLVEATRMESGKVVLRLDAVDIAALLSSAIESLSLLINKRNLTIERSIPARLPPVLGDRDRLLRVLNNLVDNAIKYSPVGGTIRIDIEFVDPNDPLLVGPGILPNTGYIKLTISDEGPGIPAEFLDRIFGKFERVDPHGPGIGLGLAIVKSIIEMHHGKVWAQSKLGEGARFSFILPIKEAN